MKTFLKLFAKIRRPFGWFITLAGFVGFIATALQIITTGDAYWVTLTGFAALFLQGFDIICSEENNANSAASTEKDT